MFYTKPQIPALLKAKESIVAHILRNFSQTLIKCNFKPKEITIPVPWGHVAGLHWNDNKSAIPVLCFHGWKDNAGSFERLIPKILSETKDYQFICIDLPGHGFSSHYPPGMLYQSTDSIIAIRRIIRHFGWSEEKGIHLMGHSLGAILAFIFAGTHPTLVDCVIAIDALVPVTIGQNPSEMAKTIADGILDIDVREDKAYEKSELYDRMLKSHMMGMNKDACDVLMKRAIIEHPDFPGKYKFSHDVRVHFLPLMEVSFEYVKSLAIAFRSKLLHIKAEKGVVYLSDYMDEKVQKWIAEGNRKLVRYQVAPKALHHVHLMEPDKIVPMILKFLSDAHK